jgi:hypothetical protein
MAKAIALARLEELQASSGRSFCPARLSAFEAAVRAVVREAAETDGA